ncbi:MAG: homoserine dehydrogenase, partial [bacterium]
LFFGIITTMPQKYKKYHIGFLGFGKVLRAFVKHYLEQKTEVAQKHGFVLDFRAIADSHSFVKGENLNVDAVILRKSKGRAIARVVNEPLKKFYPMFEAKDVDILIDGLPGSRLSAGPSYPILVEALKSGIHIICANKSPLVFKGEELFNLAEKHGGFIGLSAATAGALPTAHIFYNELINAGVYNVRGILNGTSNFVLDKIMYESKTKLQAISEAIRLGIAEPDYRFDLEGIDTCYKMIILGLVITGKCSDLRSINCRGIMDIEEEEIMKIARSGKAVRLIGNLSVNNGAPQISVSPEVLDKDDPLYAVRQTNKGITFNTKYMGSLTLIGGASGLTAIAATILKDIINIHRKITI